MEATKAIRRQNQRAQLLVPGQLGSLADVPVVDSDPALDSEISLPEIVVTFPDVSDLLPEAKHDVGLSSRTILNRAHLAAQITPEDATTHQGSEETQSKPPVSSSPAEPVVTPTVSGEGLPESVAESIAADAAEGTASAPSSEPQAEGNLPSDDELLKELLDQIELGNDEETLPVIAHESNHEPLAANEKLDSHQEALGSEDDESHASSIIVSQDMVVATEQSENERALPAEASIASRQELQTSSQNTPPRLAADQETGQADSSEPAGKQLPVENQRGDGQMSDKSGSGISEAPVPLRASRPTSNERAALAEVEPASSRSVSAAQVVQDKKTTSIESGAQIRPHRVDMPAKPQHARHDQYIELVNKLANSSTALAPSLLLFTSAEAIADASNHVEQIANHYLVKKPDAKILLVDGRLKQRALSGRLAGRSSCGLAEAIHQGEEWQELVCQTRHSNLSFLPAGNGLLSFRRATSERLAELCLQWKSSYDCVIIDGGDQEELIPRLLCPFCDATYLLVTLGVTEASVAKAAVTELRAYGARLLGCVVSEQA